jgi:hypothetical protein
MNSNNYNFPQRLGSPKNNNFVAFIDASFIYVDICSGYFHGFPFLFYVAKKTKTKSPERFSESGAVDISSNP